MTSWATALWNLAVSKARIDDQSKVADFTVKLGLHSSIFSADGKLGLKRDIEIG